MHISEQMQGPLPAGFSAAAKETMPHCAGCQKCIVDQYYLTAVDGTWHFSCLKCSDCNKLLQNDLSCFWKDGQIFCKNDYISRFWRRNCSRCNEKIQCEQLVMRAGISGSLLLFHIDCFTCSQCEQPLKPGDSYGLVGDRLYCRSHYETLLRSSALSACSSGSPASCSEGTPAEPSPLPVAAVGASPASKEAAVDHSKSPMPTFQFPAQRAPFVSGPALNQQHQLQPGCSPQSDGLPVPSVPVQHSETFSAQIAQSVEQPMAGTVVPPSAVPSTAPTVAGGCGNMPMTSPLQQAGQIAGHGMSPYLMHELDEPVATLAQHAAPVPTETLCAASTPAPSLISSSGVGAGPTTGKERRRDRRGGQHREAGSNDAYDGQMKKRQRTSFQQDQLEKLREAFKENPAPDANELAALADRVGLNKRILQVWFQNARAKLRRQGVFSPGRVSSSKKKSTSSTAFDANSSCSSGDDLSNASPPPQPHSAAMAVSTAPPNGPSGPLQGSSSTAFTAAGFGLPLDSL